LGESDHSQHEALMSPGVYADSKAQPGPFGRKLELPSIGVHASPPQSPSALSPVRGNRTRAGVPAAEKTGRAMDARAAGLGSDGQRGAAAKTLLPSSGGVGALSLAPSVASPIRRTHVREGSASGDELAEERPRRDKDAVAAGESGPHRAAQDVSDAVLASVGETLRLVAPGEMLSDEWMNEFMLHARWCAQSSGAATHT
jgi:nucleotide-binding universal stress UspA family protein